MKKRFEHLVTSCYGAEFSRVLEEYEEDGWELVSEYHNGWNRDFTLKRPVEAEDRM